MYKILATVKYDGKDREPDAECDFKKLPKADITWLISEGWIEKIKEKSIPAKKKEKP